MCLKTNSHLQVSLSISSPLSKSKPPSDPNVHHFTYPVDHAQSQPMAYRSGVHGQEG